MTENLVFGKELVAARRDENRVSGEKWGSQPASAIRPVTQITNRLGFARYPKRWRLGFWEAQMADLAATKEMSSVMCRDRTATCREWTGQTTTEPHRVLLEYIARTWGKVGGEIETRARG